MRPVVILQTIALAFAVASSAGSALADETFPIEQGWTVKDKTSWYTLTQGSRLIPLAWMRALEQPGSTTAFLDKSHIEKFRYLPQPGLGALPVGFTVDSQRDNKLKITRLRWKAGQGDSEPWVGMNCSACHSNEITYQGKRMRIEGAPTIADFQGFMEAFSAALRETRDNGDKWNRFATAVLKGADTANNRTMLQEAFAKLVAWERKVEVANATPLRYGFARLDAFGHIFNKVALLADPDTPPVNPADAPVSYPFLWNIPQFDRVQWNGIAKNLRLENQNKSLDLGALARNAGEVVGVFGDVRLQEFGLARGGYPSSLNVENLETLEGLLGKLVPPEWPAAVFGKIDNKLRQSGETLFMIKGCVNCHEPLDRKDLRRQIAVNVTLLRGPEPAGTDVWMACNAYTYEAPTGILRGALSKYFVGFPLLRDTTPLAEMLANTVLGALHANKLQIKREVADLVFGQRPGATIAQDIQPELRLPELIRPERDPSREARFRRCMTESSPILGYKGRPLTGIWATPPYLHSGAVPTLYDLLLPPEQRPQSFFLGSREFDPIKVGFVTQQSPENSFEFRTRGPDGRMIDGNSNAGHDYNNAALTEEDRKALVEYMKSL